MPRSLGRTLVSPLLGALLCAQAGCPAPPGADGGAPKGSLDGGLFDGGALDASAGDGGVPSELTVRVLDDVPPPDPDAGPPVAGLLPATASPRDDVEVVDVGLLPVHDGRAPALEVGLPADASALSIVAYAHDDVHVVLLRAEGPGGVTLVDDEEPDGLSQVGRAAGRGFPAQFFSPNRVLAARGVGAFLLPNTPDVPFGPGAYRLELGAFVVEVTDQGLTPRPSDRPVRVALVVRRGPRLEEGSVGLTVHLTGGDGLTAETAPAHARLQQALSRMRLAYVQVGIDLDEPRYLDVDDPSLRTVVLEDDVCEGGDLDTLLAKAAPGDGSLHIFLVERFRCLAAGGVDVGQGIGGMAGGIPGPPLVTGSVRSGVAVATSLFLEDPALLSTVMAHETGHFLGLYHTQESNLLGGPAIYDVIADTPDDERAAENLMYFRAGTETALTPGQGFVLRSSPWVRP